MTVVVEGPARDVASVLDEARGRIADLEARGYEPDRLAVPASVYEAIVAAKRAEIERDGQIFLLGLALVDGGCGAAD